MLQGGTQEENRYCVYSEPETSGVTPVVHSGRVLVIRALGDSKLTNSLGEGHTRWGKQSRLPLKSSFTMKGGLLGDQGCFF